MADGDRTLNDFSIQASYRGIAKIEKDAGGNQEAPFHHHFQDDLGTGTGDDQADRIFTDKRTVSTGTPDDIDMRDGSIDGRDGKTFVIAELKGLLVVNLSGTAKLTIGGAASNAYDKSPFESGTALLIIEPGGHLSHSCPKDGKNAVTSSTKVLRVISDSASTEYEITIVGASA